MVTPSFEERVGEYAKELGQLLYTTLPIKNTTTLGIDFLFGEPRATITLDKTELTVDGVPRATLSVLMGLRPDASRRYLAVTLSTFKLVASLDREPLFRLEFRDDMRSKPSAHWQVHAERGALSHLLTLSGRSRPHELSALHIPVGGTRFRPGIEDFLGFIIEECGVDARDGYREVLQRGRETWRRRQVAAIVRDVPDEAVRSLEELGYAVTIPADGPSPTRPATLTDW
jgi:hypothetical protein